MRRGLPDGIGAGGAPPAVALDTRREAWAWGEARLRALGMAGGEARLEAEVLLRHAAALSREELLVRPDVGLAAPAAAAYAALIERRSAGCPTAYLVGHREFFGIDLLVDTRVLIPRPETERLVEVVRDALRGRRAPLIVDVGTGSGAVAIALASLSAAARVMATDSSAEALAVARGNAERAGVAGRITWAEGAGLGPLAGRGLAGRVDALVSNPPYIPTEQVAALPPEVRDHEPREALDGGPDGLTVHREVVAHAVHYLRHGGWLALEVAATGGQARAVAALINGRGGYAPPQIIRDYAGAERVVLTIRDRDDADHRN